MNLSQLLEQFDRLSEAPEAIPRLRRFILNLAVRGKLVEQRQGETLEAQIPDLCGTSGANDPPFPVPESWTWGHVGDLADCRLGKMLDKAKNRGTPRRYLRNVSVRWFDFDLSDVYEMRFEDWELDEYSLRRGDVLICEGGEPGRAAVWDERESDIYFQKAVHRVRFRADVDPHFFVNVLRQSADSGVLATYFTGVGIKHFTGKGLASFVFPLPPLAEQLRVVGKIGDLMALCDRLEAEQAERERQRDRLAAASLNRLNQPSTETPTFREHVRFQLEHLPRLVTQQRHVEQLRKTILNLAVGGQLVAQDPNDEPATAVIKCSRIEKERLVKEGKLKKLRPTSAGADIEGPFQLSEGWTWGRIEDLFTSVTDGDHLPPPKTQTGVPFLVIGSVRSQQLDFSGCRHVSEDYYEALD